MGDLQQKLRKEVGFMGIRAAYCLFIFCLAFPKLYAQGICGSAEFEKGGFELASYDICHTEPLNVKDISGANKVLYYHDYRGQSYDELLSLGIAAPTYDAVTRPGVYTLIQIGEKNGQRTVDCKEVKVRHSNSAVFSYSFCGDSKYTIEINIPEGGVNTYDKYEVHLNKAVTEVVTLPYTQAFEGVGGINEVKVIGVGGAKECTGSPAVVQIPGYNPAGRDYEYFPALKELRIEKTGAVVDLKGEYNKTYNLFMYESGLPYSSSKLHKSGLAVGLNDIELPSLDKSYCFYVEPTTEIGGCMGLIGKRSAELCSVPLKGAVFSPYKTNVSWQRYEWARSGYPQAIGTNINTPSMEVVRSAGSSTMAFSTPISGITYTDETIDCSLRNCYRVKVTTSGRVGSVNYRGVSYSNEICVDRSKEEPPAPTALWASHEAPHNVVNLNPATGWEIETKKWLLYRHTEGTSYALVDSVDAPSQFVTDHHEVRKPESYRVAFVDRCGSISDQSQSMAAIYAEEDFGKVSWNIAAPFIDSDIVKMEVIYLNEDTNTPNLVKDVGMASTYTPNLGSYIANAPFQVRATAADGKVSYSNIVRIPVNTSVYLPNVFTPNGDNLNDVLLAKGDFSKIKDFSLELFTYKGQMVFKSAESTEGWDGLLPNKTKAAPGVYFYKLSFTLINGEVTQKAGNFTVMY